MTALSVKDLSHSYGDVAVLKDISFDVEPGQFVCLLGPSGCGKSTLLRLAAGLERVQSGSVSLHGNIVGDGTHHVPPESRSIGLMFQDYALFPHLTIAENIGFGLTELPPLARRERVAEVLAQVNMARFANEYPHTLSGGEQQRIALARALAPNPQVMLLDEPFSGLDETLRIQVREETLRVLDAAGTAVLMVTHHPEEAMFMSDRMMVMGPGGHIHQSGSPDDVYAHPQNRFVATFFGRTNMLQGVVQNGSVATPLGDVPAPNKGDGCDVDVIFRSNSVVLSEKASVGTPIEIISARLMGRDTRVKFKVADHPSLPPFLCRVPGIFRHDPEQIIHAHIDPSGAFVFHRSGSVAEQVGQK